MAKRMFSADFANKRETLKRELTFWKCEWSDSHDGCVSQLLMVTSTEALVIKALTYNIE